MVRLIAVLMLCGMATAFASPSASSSPAQPAQSTLDAAAPGAELPPLPRGRATVIGGRISEVNPVLDQFSLRVFGGKTMKIFYDARTRVYLNGDKISTIALHPEDHASVETTLDGASVYALNIHILSRLPQGESEGQVISYDPRTGDLKLNATLTRRTIQLQVPAGTAVSAVGQVSLSSARTSLASLSRGTLVDVKFTGGSDGRGVATHISILATPGASYVFGGNVSYLDLHAGRLVIVDPRDRQTYQVSFDPGRFPEVRNLHEGSHIRVTADFDGTRYVASAIDTQ